MKRTVVFFLLFSLLLTLTSCGQSIIQSTTLPESTEATVSTEPPTQATTQPPTQTSTELPTQTSTEPTTQPPTEPSTQSVATPDELAARLLAGMTIEEKVGQMFFVRCPAENATETASKYHFGGYLMFARDFRDRTAEEAAGFISGIQADANIPLLIGTDEEGGTVNRVSSYYREEPFRSPRDLYAEGGFELIVSDAAEKAELLLSIGVNLNLAPVCDITDDPEDYIYARSFGGDPELVSEYVRKVVERYNAAGIGCSLKHFPGYGNNKDTHVGLSYDRRDYDSFVSSEFLPFIAGIEAGAGSVLVSHNVVTCMDGENPASLSPELHRVLREELDFDRVIITDALDMDAITDFAPNGEAAVLAVLAGNDLLCCTDYSTQLPAVLNAVQAGRISLSRIDESVLRILKWKAELGLIGD